MARASRSSQTTKATLGVRELVLEGELSPGERVPEVALAERLGVSRTPLRIALGTLAHEGLLEPLRGGGFVVRSFTRSDIADAIELRGVLEGTAARLATERLGANEELDVLVATTEELIRLAHSPTLERAIEHAMVLPFAAPGALLASHALLPRAREILVVAQFQHRALIDAIRSGHGSRAESLAREHARLAQINLELVLEDHAALAALRGAPLLRSVV